MNELLKLVFILYIFICSIHSQEWKFANGPYSAEIRKIAIDPAHPDTLYATGNGLYRSFDGGENWTRLLLPVVGDIESDIAVDPNNSNIIYFGSNSLFKSIDYGDSWQQLGFADRDVITIKINPLEPQSIYVGLDFTHESGDAIWLSKDGGESWVQKTYNIPMDITGCTAIEVNPLKSKQIYAATTWAGIFKSMDGAETWSYAGFDGGLISDISIIPWDTSYVLVATWAGLYKSQNSGLNWFKVMDGDIRSLDTDLSNRIIYAGKHWGEGIFKSMDNGNTWIDINNDYIPAPGSDAGYVFDIEVNPKYPEEVYLATGVGPYKTYNSGETWYQKFKGMAKFFAFDIAIAPSDPAIVYAAGRPGVHRSNDYGASWKYIGAGWVSEIIEIHPVNPDIIYITTSGNDMLNRVFVTLDGGKTWRFANVSTPGLLPFIKIAPNYPYPVYTSASAYNILVSYDSGELWQNITTPFRISTSIAIPKYDDDQIYIGSMEGIYHSEDKGQSWTLLGLTEYDNINRIGLNEKEEHTIYAACRKYGFFKTENGGQDWYGTNEIFADYYFSDFIINPRNPAHLFLSSGLSGIYQSRSSGDLWEKVNPDPPDSSVKAIAFDPTGSGILYYSAGTKMPGIYILDNVLNSIENKSEQRFHSFFLRQNCPNPFNTSTFIIYRLPIRKFVKLEIYDIIGKRIRSLKNVWQNPGKYKVKWDGKRDDGRYVASGVYIYQLSLDTKLLSKKMLLIK